MKNKFTLFTLAIQASLFSISVSTAAVMSVDIEEINTVSAADPTVLYRFQVIDQLIDSTPPNFSNPASVSDVSELGIFDRVERHSSLEGSRGVYVDLQEDSANSDLVSVFLYPMVSGHSTHSLGITIDFDLDTNQIIDSFTFNGGDLWSTPTPADVIPVFAVSNNGTSITIDYEFTSTALNPGAQQTMSSTSSFDQFTLTLVTVPEPTSALLISIGGLTTLLRRRR
ncbi:MAG: PEP-CTERM sorting domain-containing protein [Akkermansiaceae bacterium]